MKSAPFQLDQMELQPTAGNPEYCLFHKHTIIPTGAPMIALLARTSLKASSNAWPIKDQLTTPKLNAKIRLFAKYSPNFRLC